MRTEVSREFHECKMDENHETEAASVKELSASQRRILGVLVEKAFTTPEYYPLTLKAVTTGCNQKSNRHPIVNYSEDHAAKVLDELRELGLVAEIHTESGRTERYRHYMRKRFSFTEPQLAILIELLLRGRQTQGELRSRASRMVPIDSLEHLRQELAGLMDMNLVLAGGPLERRGVEVDHNLYTESERNRQEAFATEVPASPEGEAASDSSARVVQGSGADTSGIGQRITGLEASVETLRIENSELRSELQELQEQVRQLGDQVDQLRRDLGG